MRVFLALLALVASLTVVSCGGDDAPPTMMPPPDGDSGTVTPPAPPTPPPGQVMLNVVVNLPDGMVIPTGSMVVIDSDVFALTTPPMEIPVDPGSHTVTVNMTGWRARTVTVETGTGQPNTAHVPVADAQWDGLSLGCDQEPRDRYTTLFFPEDEDVIYLRCFLGDACDAFVIDGNQFSGVAGIATVEGSVNPEFTQIQYTVDGAPGNCSPKQ